MFNLAAFGQKIGEQASVNMELMAERAQDEKKIIAKDKDEKDKPKAPEKKKPMKIDLDVKAPIIEVPSGKEPSLVLDLGHVHLFHDSCTSSSVSRFWSYPSSFNLLTPPKDCPSGVWFLKLIISFPLLCLALLIRNLVNKADAHGIQAQDFDIFSIAVTQISSSIKYPKNPDRALIEPFDVKVGLGLNSTTADKTKASTVVVGELPSLKVQLTKEKVRDALVVLNAVKSIQPKPKKEKKPKVNKLKAASLAVIASQRLTQVVAHSPVGRVVATSLGSVGSPKSLDAVPAEPKLKFMSLDVDFKLGLIQLITAKEIGSPSVHPFLNFCLWAPGQVRAKSFPRLAHSSAAFLRLSSSLPGLKINLLDLDSTTVIPIAKFDMSAFSLTTQIYSDGALNLTFSLHEMTLIDVRPSSKNIFRRIMAPSKSGNVQPQIFVEGNINPTDKMTQIKINMIAPRYPSRHNQ